MREIFFVYRDSPQRRAALAAPVGSPARYLLFGLDELRERGFGVRHSLEGTVPSWARHSGALVKRGLERAGGYGGDFPSVFASLGDANGADVVLSTVDTVGIPLVLAARARLLRKPFVYVAVGLPERLARLRGDRMRRLYADSLGRARSVVTYSEHEADVLREWLTAHDRPTRVQFVPFGVDTSAIGPASGSIGDEVVSVGADPHRDFELLFAVAARHPDVPFRVVATADRVRTLGDRPANVTVEQDLPFDEMLSRLRAARAVALPVRENSYSGATTVLLQAMALAKPVVVSETKAIERGYGLLDRENVMLVPPGDAEAFERALSDVLADAALAVELGASARRLAECELSWSAYVDRIARVVDEVAGSS